MGDLVERLRSADMNSQQRVLGSRIFGEAADEITRLRAALADAQAVGFAAGVEAAAKVAVPDERSMHADQSEYMAGARHAGWRIHGEIRALTPPDATAAAARVLLDDLAKSHTDHPDAHDRWQRINAAMGGSVGPWLVFIDALRAIAGDTP